VTLKRLDLVLQHFFRRVKLGQKQGCPRFKSLQLNVQEMTCRPSPQQDESGRYIANGAKAGLNREILSTAPGMCFGEMQAGA
jgi:hypothetical protein